MTTQPKKDPLGSAWMVVAAVLFTIMNILIKSAGQKFGYQSSEIVFWRMAFALASLAAFARLHGESFATPHLCAHIKRSITGTTAMFFLFYALMHLPLATGVTLSYTSSIFLAILSFVLLKEKISGFTQAMLVLGFAGIILLLRPSFSAGQEWAALAGLIGGAVSGWAYLQVRQLSLLGEPAWKIVFYLSLVGTTMSFVWACFSGWHPVTAQSLPYLAGIGITALLAQLAMTHAYKVGRKFTVAALAYLTVVFSTLAGMILMGDKTGWQEWLGMGMITASGLLMGLRR